MNVARAASRRALMLLPLWKLAQKSRSLPRTPVLLYLLYLIQGTLSGERFYTSASRVRCGTPRRKVVLPRIQVGRKPKTGSLVREIADLDTIVVDNDREALALRTQPHQSTGIRPKFQRVRRDDNRPPVNPVYCV